MHSVRSDKRVTVWENNWIRIWQFEIFKMKCHNRCHIRSNNSCEIRSVSQTVSNEFTRTPIRTLHIRRTSIETHTIEGIHIFCNLYRINAFGWANVLFNMNVMSLVISPKNDMNGIAHKLKFQPNRIEMWCVQNIVNFVVHIHHICLPTSHTHTSTNTSRYIVDMFN